MASLLIRQKAGSKGDSIAHELRNLIGIRAWNCSCARPVWVRSQALTMTSLKNIVRLVEERLSLLARSRKSLVFADQTA